MNAETKANEAEPVHGAAAFAARVAQMAGTAERELLLFSDALDGRLWGGAELAESLRQFLLRHHQTRLQILVNQAQAALHNAPHLIELARRLTSRVEVREPPEHARQNYRGELLIADRRLLLERRQPGALVARYWPQAPAVTQVQAGQFNEWWNEAAPSDELRSLGI